MKLISETKTAVVFNEVYEGKNGQACISRNYGINDKVDHYSVCVKVGSKFKQLATRAKYEKAVAMAEAAID